MQVHQMRGSLLVSIDKEREFSWWRPIPRANHGNGPVITLSFEDRRQFCEDRRLVCMPQQMT